MKKTDSSREEKFVAALRSGEYIVKGGGAELVYPADFVKEHVIDSAAGNNAGQPYKRLQIPEFGPPLTAGEKTSGVFRLRPDEAIVYAGLTPPEGDYFSFTPFLWTRHDGATIEKGDWIFAAVGDPLNNAGIKTESGNSTFRDNTIIIFTADRKINAALVALAIEAGYPKSMINTYVIPSELLTMGVDQTDDSFLILVRVANVYDQQAKDDYNDNDHYAGVYRITPTVPRQPDPFPIPPLRDRKATPEELLVPTAKSLAESLDDLENAILAQISCSEYRIFDSNRWFAESRDVLNTTDPQLMLYHKFVAGEASDTPYLRSAMSGVPANFTLRADEMVIVYGVNHEATGLATYSNFSVYGENILNPLPKPYVFGHHDPVWSGVAGMGSKDSEDPLNGPNNFTNSARQFIPDDPNVDYLYAVRVVRQSPYAQEMYPFVTVPEPTEKDGPASGIEMDAPVTIGYRAYLNPATGSGPSYKDIIPDRAIWFKMK